MFQFSGLASHAYLIQHAIIQGPWDQRLFDNSPKLFAAYHALHRLLSPRHPPHALCNLTTMICGSLTRTETLQPPDGHEKTCPPMQFEDYVVAELSKINAHQAISTTLSWVGRPCCGTRTLNADYAMVKPLTCVFLESRVASNRWPQINSLSHDAAFAMVATHVSMNRRCQPPLASIIESNLSDLSRFNQTVDTHANQPRVTFALPQGISNFRKRI